MTAEQELTQLVTTAPLDSRLRGNDGPYIDAVLVARLDSRLRGNDSDTVPNVMDISLHRLRGNDSTTR